MGGRRVRGGSRRRRLWAGWSVASQLGGARGRTGKSRAGKNSRWGPGRRRHHRARRRPGAIGLPEHRGSGGAAQGRHRAGDRSQSGTQAAMPHAAAAIDCTPASCVRALIIVMR